MALKTDHIDTYPTLIERLNSLIHGSIIIHNYVYKMKC